MSAPGSRDVSPVAIVGAGLSGTAMAIRLQQEGIPFRIYEKSDAIGGTWRYNTYPGLACDVPAIGYTYSFAVDVHSDRLLAPGSALRDYHQRVFDAHGLGEHLSLGSEIVDAEWLGDRWSLLTGSGERHEHRIVVHATGFLHHPKYPEISGLDDFAGPVMHTARWNDDVDLGDKRVAVLGSGSSGVQVVAALAGEVEHLTMFQRTPQWMFPLPDFTIPGPVLAALRRWPVFARGVRSVSLASFSRILGRGMMKPNSVENKIFGWLCRRNLARVKDPDLRRKLTPDEPIMCRRPVMTTKFYPAVQHPDVTVETSRIAEVTPTSIRTEDGVDHPVDVIVLATGFDSHAYMRPMEITGQDGLSLGDVWAARPLNYGTMMIPGFPNMFMMLGPNFPVTHVGLHASMEGQAGYITKAITEMRRRDVASIAPTREATDRWYEEVGGAFGGTTWSLCSSWYVGDDGTPVLWPFSKRRWIDHLDHPDLDDFELQPDDAADVATDSPSTDTHSTHRRKQEI
ncbi:flavin-containing monooxygenase [Gordonia sp. NPDC003376]